MPKISAPTVAEHRAKRRAALLLAGETILREEGLTGITPGSVTEQAGLSRSSFYDYFDAKDDLLAAMAIDAFEQWGDAVDAAMSRVAPGLPALQVVVEVTLSRAADGKHAIAGALQEANLAPSRMEDLMAMHTTLLRPIEQILADMAIPEPATMAMIVQSVLNVGVQLVAHGVDPQQAGARVFAFMTRGLAS